MVELGKSSDPNFKAKGEIGENSPIRFPETLSEYIDQIKSHSVVNRVFDAMQLAQEASEAYWAEQKLAWEVNKPDFFADDVQQGEQANVILLPGFIAWKGILEGTKFGKLPWAPWSARGCYASTIAFFEAKGCDVEVVFPGKSFNDGSIDATVDRAADLINETHQVSDKPIVLVGHSLGGIAEYFLAARHPDSARKVSTFVTVGSPLPVRVNSFVADAFVYLRGGKELRNAQEVIEFLSSKESGEMKAKMTSWLSDSDHVIDGPTPTIPIIENAGHSSLLYRKHLLEGIIAGGRVG